MRRLRATCLIASAVAATIVAPAAEAAPTCFGKTPTISGTADDDTLTGTAGRDVIFAGPGRDTVHGRGGNDLICGGTGEDEGLYGDGGNDRIHAGRSERTTIVYGGAGDDFLYDAPGGGDGQQMFGGPGDDVLKAGDSNGTYIDELDGGPGNDLMEQGRAEGVFFGGEGDDVMRGGKWSGDFDVLVLDEAPGPIELDMTAGTMTGWGTDTVEEMEIVSGGEFDDTITGDDQRNFIIGGGGDDTLGGRAGNDCLLGSATDVHGYQRCLTPYELDAHSGNDVLSGGDGDDVLTGGDGDDTITGDEGVDTTWFASSRVPVTVDLGAGVATGDGNDLLDVEGVVGSSFGDTLTGSAGADTLVAGLEGPTGPPGYQGTGGDVMRGLAGDDRLDVIGGADADGGDGSDTVSYQWLGVRDPLEIDLRSDSDSLDDTLAGIENVTGPPNAATVTTHGDDGPNVLFGAGGEDEIFGYGGDDVIMGWFGNDDLDGGEGNDSLDGGPGAHNGYDVCLNGETTRNCDWFEPA